MTREKPPVHRSRALQSLTRAIAAIAFAAAAPFVIPASAQSVSSHRFCAASQYDASRNLGFALGLEGARLGEVSVVLTIGDGTTYREARCQPGLAGGRDYVVTAIVAPEGARLLVDGALAAESPGAWRPAPGPFVVNPRSELAGAACDWLARVVRVSAAITRDGNEAARLDWDFSAAAARPLPAELFAPEQAASRSAAFDTRTGDMVRVDLALNLGSTDLEHWAPFIDCYGQFRYADWPDKVRSDDDLRGDIAREDLELSRMPGASDCDEYGGYTKAGWREEATGFFRVTRRGGYWWLVTPTGNPCFYLGVCNFPDIVPATPIGERQFLFEWLPPPQDPWSQAWARAEYVSFHVCNSIRKYPGQDWREQATARGIRRLRAWGFSGCGKWDAQAPPTVVSTPVLSAGNTPRLVRHPDVFDPAVCEIFRGELERQIAPRRDDPRVLGWSVGNEFNEIISRADVAAILAKPATTPAKRALLDHAVETIYDGSLANLRAAWKLDVPDREALYAASPAPPPKDLERLRCFYADRYYGFIYQTIKSLDPNHLYLGFWIMPGAWQSEEDWRLIARHCDVIGYDRYARDYESPLLQRLQAETDKPTLCGEFGFPAYYDGRRGLGRYPVFARDDAEAGELYLRWVEAAARDRYCVGLLFFMYRDQPVTGRGPGRGRQLVFNEHYAFGLVTETDRPKWPLVRRMREANLRAAGWRRQAAGGESGVAPSDRAR